MVMVVRYCGATEVALCHEEDKGGTHGDVADEEEERDETEGIISVFLDGSTMSAALTVPAIARASVAIKSRLVVFRKFFQFSWFSSRAFYDSVYKRCIFAKFRAWILTIIGLRRSAQTTVA